LFGSWNGFRQGEELEYQGKQVYFAIIKLPVGSWVYRFQIDKEDWETNNETAKTIKDGVEYNTMPIKEKEDSDEEVEEKCDDKKGNKLQHTQVIFDESSQKFVVGRKKRHGRPSMELDLGKDFDYDNSPPEEAEEADEEEDEQENVAQEKTTDGVQEDANNIDDSATTSETSAAKSRKRNNNKNERKKRRKRKAAMEQQDKEVARKVFVEQLRQQQQHEDELNRVKLLWKQERQVRVEAHKKIVQEKNKLAKDMIELRSEIERLQTVGKMDNFNENKQINQLQVDKKKYEMDMEKCQKELKKNTRSINFNSTRKIGRR